MHSDISGIMHRHILRLLHRIGNNGRVVYLNINRIMHRHILRQCHLVGNDGSIVHSIRDINIGCVMNCNIGRIMHRNILFLRHSIGNNGSIVYSVRRIDIDCVVYPNILRLRHRIGNNGSVVHSIRDINIGRVMHIYICCVMYSHRVDLGRGRCGFRSRRGCRRRFVFSKLPAERQPHGVTGMQGMNVHMGDGVEVRHLIGFSNRVDRLALLDDVHIVPATVQHLCLKTHFDRRGARLLGPC